MDIFVIGVFAGMIAAIILIGVISIGMDKGKSDESGSNSINNNVDDWNNRCLDRHIKTEVEILEMAKKLGVKFGA